MVNVQETWFWPKSQIILVSVHADTRLAGSSLDAVASFSGISSQVICDEDCMIQKCVVSKGISWWSLRSLVGQQVLVGPRELSLLRGIRPEHARAGVFTMALTGPCSSFETARFLHAVGWLNHCQQPVFKSMPDHPHRLHMSDQVGVLVTLGTVSDYRPSRMALRALLVVVITMSLLRGGDTSPLSLRLFV